MNKFKHIFGPFYLFISDEIQPEKVWYKGVVWTFLFGKVYYMREENPKVKLRIVK